MTAHVIEFHHDPETVTDPEDASYFMAECVECGWHPQRELTGEEFESPFFGGVIAAENAAIEHNTAEHPEPGAGRPDWATVARWADERSAARSTAGK